MCRAVLCAFYILLRLLVRDASTLCSKMPSLEGKVLRQQLSLLTIAHLLRVECRICNRQVASLNLIRGYFAPRSTQPSIPPRLVNEYHLRLGQQRQVWHILLADETQGVQVKL